MNDDQFDTPLDDRLRQAGSRLRDDAPDAIATAQAFSRRHERSAAQRPPNRNWWPALAGAGLVGAAVIGVVAYGAIDQDDAIVTPVDTSVSTELPSPTATSEPVDSTVTSELPGTSATTQPVVDVDVPDSAAPPETVTTETTPSTTSPAGAPGCDPGTAAPTGAELVTVACRNVSDTTAVLVAQVPTGEAVGAATRWFVNSSRWPDGIIELGSAFPVSGLTPDTISFLPVLDNGVTCVVIVQPSSGEWKEDCWLDVPPEQVVTDMDGATVQFDLRDATAITATALGDNAWKSSGCDAFDIGELAARSDVAGSLYLAVGCSETSAVIVASSIFMQPGGPDGSIWLYERVSDVWEMVDNGTGIDTDLALPIPPPESWAAWPGDLQPRVASIDLDELNARPRFADLTTAEAAADAALSVIADGREPEFTGPAFPLEIVEIVDDIIVIESIEGGDDSSAGTAHYIHVGRDPSGDRGYVVTHWFTSTICARGGGPDLCV